MQQTKFWTSTLTLNPNLLVTGLFRDVLLVALHENGVRSLTEDGGSKTL